MFWCPGCGMPHQVGVGAGDGPRWGYNGDPDRPTFAPSVLVTSHELRPPVTPDNLAEFGRNPWPQEKVQIVCHSFVTAGQIQFLGDCTHALAGQTVDLPAWPEPTP